MPKDITLGLNPFFIRAWVQTHLPIIEEDIDVHLAVAIFLGVWHVCG